MNYPKLHTPAPWHACHDGACRCGLIWSNPSDIVVAAAMDNEDENYTGGRAVEPMSGEFMANAKLIAAAPELLESVENLVGVFDNAITRMKGNSMQLEAIEIAKKALKKAYTGIDE